ncbi:hypothetical protein, partial [Streptomyces roseolus]|uniref:hypothetical protein n=1 Tax=Streptomyces roseolus TaxID=67358 RepID=UPI00364FF6D9
MAVLAAGRATTVKAGGEATAAFRHDLAALAQCTAREGTGTIPARGHTETFLTDGEQHGHKLGIGYADTEQRRDKLNPARRTRPGGRPGSPRRRPNRHQTAPPGHRRPHRHRLTRAHRREGRRPTR